MAKSKQIVIRVSYEQHKFIKEMGGSFSQIWQIGFEQWSHDFPEYLQKKAKEYDKLYSECIYKMQKCISDVYTKNKDLDKLVKEYIATGRSIEHPTAQDKNWIKARITKLNGVSIKRFFDYANGRFNKEKQQYLGGIYG